MQIIRFVKKEKNAIYIKHFKHIILLTILNLKNVIYTFVKKKTINIYSKKLYNKCN